MNIAGIEIGAGQPCRFVAELSNNHNGSLDRALRMVSAAKAAGADLIKWQCYTPDELVQLRGDGPAPEPWGAQGWTMRTLYQKAQTPHAWFPTLAAWCDSIGIPWFSSVFGPQSLDLLQGLGCPAYKIARLDNRQDGLAALVRATGKPRVVSAARGECPSAWKYSVDELDDDVVLSLYCPPGYPQQDMRFLSGSYAEPDEWPTMEGFSYHGTDWQVPALSVAFGAHLVEVHFQLFHEPSELEANVSLDEFGFADMVRLARKIESVM